ncbi:MAG: ribonuclease HII [Candidatus Dormibacteria bacterium]
MPPDPDPLPWQLIQLGACGMDEVGRGALAGPLVAAAVVLPPGFSHPLLRDSKLLSEPQREEVEPAIRAAALALGVAAVQVSVIDDRGVGWANRIAFERLIRLVTAEAYLADGNLPLRTRRRYLSVVGGDRLVPAISAASIVAKVHRDRLMRQLHPSFPHYGWDENKGYGTPRHLRAISQHGLCRHHRRSFIHEPQPSLFEALAAVSG